jgi:hypothetical protein
MHRSSHASEAAVRADAETFRPPRRMLPAVAAANFSSLMKRGGGRTPTRCHQFVITLTHVKLLAVVKAKVSIFGLYIVTK